MSQPANAYALPTYADVNGTFAVTIYSSTAGLTMPTYNTIKEIGETKETIDIKVGTTEYGTCILQVSDDYTVYPEGFWYQILNSTTEFKITLNEGAGETYYFYGEPQALGVSWDEYYLGSTRIRVCTITLTTMMQSLVDQLITTFEANVYSNRQATTITPPTTAYEVISFKGMFAAMLCGMGNTYAETDCTLTFDTSNPDFKFIDGSANTRNLSQIYIPVVAHDGASTTTCNYWQDATGGVAAARLSQVYSTLGDFIKDVCLQFGFAIRLGYDIAGNKYTIELVQKGRAYSGTLDFSSREKVSTIIQNSNLQGETVRFTEIVNTANLAWISIRWSAGIIQTTAPGAWVTSFDIDRRCPFVVNFGGGGTAHAEGLFMGATLATLVDTASVSFWDYGTSAYVNTALITTASARYNYKKIATPLLTITRRYGKMKADAGGGDTHTVLNIGRRASINDGISAMNFFANQVVKIPKEAECEIEWIEEP